MACEQMVGRQISGVICSVSKVGQLIVCTFTKLGQAVGRAR